MNYIKSFFVFISTLIAAVAMTSCGQPNPGTTKTTKASPPAPTETAPAPGKKIALDQNAISIDWAVVKIVAGQEVSMMGGWDDSGKIVGEAVLNEDGSLSQINASIDLATLWTEVEVLTDTMKQAEAGFFNVTEHPQATFTSTAITAGAPEGSSDATHTITGTLQINGVEQALRFPASIKTEAGKGIELKAKLSLDRQTFNVKLLKSLSGLDIKDDEIHNDVAISVKVKIKES